MQQFTSTMENVEKLVWKLILGSKKVTAQQHIKEYNDKPFVLSAGKLFCSACREELIA